MPFRQLMVRPTADQWRQGLLLWSHKRDPYTLDAVLLYAQAGSGRRANLVTDYTFGLWHRNPSEASEPAQLVSFAKDYSGLDDGEITVLDRWIRSHTTERFGPVRAAQPLSSEPSGTLAVATSSWHGEESLGRMR